jgi:hypothetical protein
MTWQVMDTARWPGARSSSRPTSQEAAMTALAHPVHRSRTTGLATLLRVDAVLCAATGLLAAAAPAAVADVLGPDVPPAGVRWVGLALLVWAVDVALLARARGRLLRRGGVVVAVGNLAWEVATVVLVVRGAFSLPGAVTALVVGAVVGGLGLLQLRATRG